MLGFHLLLVVLIGVAGRLAGSRGQEEWSGLLERPWALGVFVSVAIAMTKITLAPPLWDVLMWMLFGVTAAVLSEKVVNWTLTSPIARMFLPVGVAYGSSVSDVLALLEAAAFSHAGVLRDPPPEALFLGFGESALDFELRVWVQDIRLRLEMRSTVLAGIESRLREAGVEIPFPQRSPPPLDRPRYHGADERPRPAA